MPDEMAEFVRKHNVKVSSITQLAIKELMDYESGAILESNASLMAKIARLQDTIQKQAEELENVRIQKAIN